MTKSIWGEARAKAAKDTLELVRLNEPSRAVLTLGVPLAIVAGAWLISHQFALTAVIGVVALVALALIVFAFKLLSNVGTFAEQARAELAGRTSQQADAESERRHTVVGRLVELYLLEMGDQAPPAIRAGLTLPPEDWLNEHLAELGEEWSIFNIQGRNYQTFEIVAGEWRYQGQRMRSPAAVKWAAFFDALGLGWQPGEEGWDPKLGVAPDFLLPQMDAWFAVEYRFNDARMARNTELARDTHKRVVIGVGLPAYAEENLYLVRPNGALEQGGWAWAEDRRDQGVYWLSKLNGMAATLLGGPGKQTDHDRGPIVTDRIKAAFDRAKAQPAEFERP
ncbi:hypothetical protein [Sphingomonas glaciei]|uniref:DUF3137 domain-containing protein n=1 Tax=Sphingomonas glaciei TaxID=2938948 RepID=A0ABY5MUY1_9SPHN|nr:hypothetical protein [Sphingomonas glaciei]UUR08293.1 hypothetical protein M1K48_01190 [Sphingomonas glaciei]